MNDEMKMRILKQIAFLDSEQQRAKILLNANGFDCTTAAFVIVKRYRDEIKSQLNILRMNLE